MKKKYITKIFDFIENGDSKFKGQPGLYFIHTKKELLEPVQLHPDKYVYLTREDIINNYDRQLTEALNYFNNHIKKYKKINGD